MNVLSYSNTTNTAAAGDLVLLFPNGIREGRQTALLTIAVAIADGETVTIDTTTYTFRTALSVPAIANEVLIGTTTQDGVLNLADAINGNEARRGIGYSLLTQEHPTVFAPFHALLTGGSGLLRVYHRFDQAVATGTFATTETLAGVGNQWGGAVSVQSDEVWVGACRIDRIQCSAAVANAVNIEILDAMVDATNKPIAQGLANGKAPFKLSVAAATLTSEKIGSVASLPMFDVFTSLILSATGMPPDIGTTLRRVYGPVRGNEYTAAVVGKTVDLPIDVEVPHGAIVVIRFTGAYNMTTEPLRVDVFYEPRGSGAVRRRLATKSLHVQAVA